MTIRQFTSDPVFRQRYWARNHIGWRHMHATRPNAGHRALAALERAGVEAQRRAETLSFAEWVRVYQELQGP
jgi:hypothetical protein